MSGIPGQQSIAYISQLGAGYAPTASGLQPNYASGFENLPFFNNQQYGPLLQMALGPTFQGLMSRVGMTGMGLGHDQNVYDRIMAQQFQAQMQTQMRNTSELDRGNYVRTLQGVSAMFGVPFGGEQRVAANRLADLAVNFAPMLAVTNPELLDKLSGSRGSAAVLGQRLATAGRYRLDPVTGRMGVDPKSIEAMTQNIMEDLYSPEKIGGMKGISAGQLGGMYEQLSLRGMVAGSEFGYSGMLKNLQGAMPQQELLQRAQALNIKGVKETGGKLDLSGISASDLDKLTKDDAVAQKLRDFDANRVKSSLKSYVSAISAMRDIFGDAGQPNAPIPELMRALEGLSTGSMGQVDPQRLGQMVRQTYYLAKSGGISADAAGLMQQDAAVRGQQLGIEAPFAMLATQSSLAYNTALRSRGVLATPVFGGMSESQLTQMNTSLMQQGVASDFGNRLGTLLRMQDLAGSDTVKNTDLGNVLDAIRSGKESATVAGKEIKIANLSNTDIEALGASAGFGRGQVQAMLGQTQASREALFKNPNAVNYIREVAQGTEIKQLLTGSTDVALQSALRSDFNIKDERTLAAVSGVSKNIIEQLMTSPDLVTANTATRTEAVAGMLQDMLPQDVRDRMFAGKTEEEQRATLKTLASTLSGNLDVVSKQRTGAGNFANLRRMMDPSLLAEGSARQLSESLRNQAREALSGISSGSALRNAIDALKDVKIDDPQAFEKVIAQSFGGVYDKKIGDALKEPINKLNTARKELDTMQKDIDNEPDPNKRRALIESYRAKAQQVENLTNEVRKVGENVNIYSATGLTQGNITTAQESAKAAEKAMRNIAVVKADDTKISQTERETKKAEMQAAADTEGKGVKITDKAAEDAIIAARRAIKPVSAANIEERMRSKNLSREAATEELQAENVAKRLGISDAEIKAKGGSYVDAVYALAQEREIKDPAVREARIAAFEKSRDAARLRDTMRGAAADREDVIKRALDPSTVRSMGIGVVEQARELKTVAQQQQNLIDKYGGSETRFLAEATKEQRAEYDALAKRSAAVMDKIDATRKAGGFTEAERAEARTKDALRVLGRNSVAELQGDEKIKFTKHVSELAAAEKLTDDDVKLIDRYSGSVDPKTKELTPEAQSKLSDVAKRIGVDVKDLGGIRGKLKDVEFEAQKERELLSASPQALTDRLKTSFGLDDKDMEAVTAALGTYSGRQKAAAIIGTQERLSGLVTNAGSGANIETLQKDYDAAIAANTKEARDSFKQKYKITSDADYERAITDIQTYNTSDLGRFKGEGGAKSLAESLAVYDDKMTKATTMPSEVNVTGRLTGAFELVEPNKLTSVGDASLNARSAAIA